MAFWPPSAPAASLAAPVVGLAPTPTGDGYLLGAADGGVFAFGDAVFHGSHAGTALSAPVVGIARDATGGGYWLVGGDGGVFAYGDAGFYDSLPGPGVEPNRPVVGIAATPSGHGYWLAGADGGIYAFGDARFQRSLPGLGVTPAAPIVGIAATPTGQGYWLAGADGGVFAFGDAGYFNSLPGQGVHPNAAIVGIAAAPTGHGYWLVGADGGVYAFGDAGFHGSLPGQGVHPNFPIVAIAPTPTGAGYWLVGADGGVFALGDAHYENSVPGVGIGPPPTTPPAVGSGAGGPGSAPGGGGGGSTSTPVTGTDNGRGPPPATCATNSVTLPGGIVVQAPCFVDAGGGRLTAGGRIRINGLDMTLTGAGTVTLDTRPGHLELRTSAAVDVYAGPLHVYHGALDWQLGKLLSLKVPDGLKIKGLAIGGDIGLSLSSGGLEVDANAMVATKIASAEFAVSGAVKLELGPAIGLKLDSLRLDLASDLPVGNLVVKGASLSYENAPTGDVWAGSVSVALPDGPTLQGTLTVTNGSVSQLGIQADGINDPIGEAVFLQQLGLNVNLAPFSATGTIGLSAGPEIDGLALARLTGNLTVQLVNPFQIKATGNLAVVDQHLADGSVSASIPGGVSLGGHLTWDFGLLKLDGALDGSIDSRHFEGSGRFKIHVRPKFDFEGAGLVNEAGVAGCGQARLFGLTAAIGAAHRWRGGNSLLYGSCGLGDLRDALPGAHGAALGAAARVMVPRRTRQINVIVGGGASGPPTVVLRHGAAAATVAPGARGRLGRAAFIALADDAAGQIAIAIVHPPSGLLEVSAPPGAPALASVASSLALPAVAVRTTLTAVGARRYRLAWRAPARAGQTLTFEDIDRRGAAVILTTARASGQTVFTALDAGARSRHRIRIVLTQDGLVRGLIGGPRFTPPRVHLGAPRVSVALGHRLATIRWSAVAGAARYEVTLATADGRHLFIGAGPRSRAARIAVSPRVVARVRALGPGLEPGPFGRATASRR